MLAFALTRRSRSTHQRYSIQGIISLADFYSQKVKLNSAVIPSQVSKDTLPVQYEVFQTFVFKEKLKWQNQQEAALANAKQLLKQEQNSQELLKSISSKQELIKIEKNSEIGRKGGHSRQSARLHIDILLKSWMLSAFSDRCKDMITMILLGSLIPPLTADVE